jgi:hypothetical protein
MKQLINRKHMGKNYFLRTLKFEVNFAKACNQWFENGCPFWKDIVLDEQVGFLQSFSSSLKVTPPFGKNIISDMNDF